MSGKFIVFEGIDGAGKTTQVELLAKRLEAAGKKAHLTAEPTALPSGKELRRVLGGEIKKSACETAVLFALDRIAHNIDEKEGIGALLDAGYDVICDRYYYSSLAYQGTVLGFDTVAALNLDNPNIRKPDICIFLDLTPEKSLRRIGDRGGKVEIYENLQTLSRVRQQFLSVIDDLEGNDNIRIIDGYRTPEEIFADIRKIVEDMD